MKVRSIDKDMRFYIVLCDAKYASRFSATSSSRESFCTSKGNFWTTFVPRTGSFNPSPHHAIEIVLKLIA
ncbi:hypothetical protein J6590_095599 [Homalodisca vitripennis]|nr:hypothetical protein J6590_005660 [Homalodisca vitripennis]KAG8294768.1 hypothetical protein J6590_095599 [Homalodisca vitripennis]